MVAPAAAPLGLPTKMKPITDMFWEICRPRKTRTYQEFMEQEFILTEGKYKGQYFSCDVEPFTKQLFKAYAHLRYRRYVIIGPRQDGKTLYGYQAPVLHTICEDRENVINGVPKVDMGKDIFRDNIRKTLKQSSYKDILPRTGKGSREGDSHAYEFRNGSIIRFLSKGLSFTAPVVCITEVNKTDTYDADTGSTVDGIIKCASSYSSEAVVFLEGVTTTKNGRIEIEYSSSTGSRIFLKCQHCGEYIVPERSNFLGWQMAKDEIEASESCYYQCQVCDAKWSEEDRAKSLEHPVIAHRGQTVNKKGKIHGAHPRTFTYGIRFNWMHSTLRTMEDIALEEYRALKSGKEASLRAVQQEVWAEPWEDTMGSESELSPEDIFGKIGQHPYGEVPANCDVVVVGIDIGEKNHWYSVMGFSKETAEGYMISYGRIPVEQKSEKTGIAMLNALRMFKANVLDYGWRKGDKMVKPNLVLVDSGHGEYNKEIYQFAHESGQARGQYYATKGLGTNEDTGWKDPLAKDNRTIGDNWYVTDLEDSEEFGESTFLVQFHTDYWKLEVHDRFRTASNTQGSMYLYNESRHHHFDYVNHILAEKRKTIILKGKSGGIQTVWDHPGGRPNHLFDTSYACVAGANMLGVKIKIGEPIIEKKKYGPKTRRTKQERQSRGHTRRKGKMRTSY